MKPIRPLARHSPVQGAVPANAANMTSFGGGPAAGREDLPEQCAEPQGGQQHKQHDTGAANRHPGRAPMGVVQRQIGCLTNLSRARQSDGPGQHCRGPWRQQAGAALYSHPTARGAPSMANTRDRGAGAGDGAHRLSRRRQDHAAEPHPHRAARPQIRGGDQRVRRTGRGQRPRRGHRRGSVRDEQRLHLLHGARRPDPHRRRADEAARPVRRDHHRDHRPGEPRPGGADVLRRRGRAVEGEAGCDRDGGGRQAPAAAAGGQPRGGRPDRLRRRDRAEQDGSGDAGGAARRSRTRSARSTASR